MPRLDRLPPVNRNNLLAFPAQVNDTAPFAPLRRPLGACRLAIVTTAGLHRRADRTFGPGEQTYRARADGGYFDARWPAVRLARSKRRWGSRRGDQRSPSLARRAGTLSMRKSSIAIPRATSSHVTGVETL